jgi:hypothetical protein
MLRQMEENLHMQTATYQVRRTVLKPRKPFRDVDYVGWL